MSRQSRNNLYGRSLRQPAKPVLDRPLVLVGLMGAGKSAIGRRLADRLGVEFVDSDDAIELAAGCSIPDIFQRYGEPAFRDVERKVIARMVTEGPKVVATGGGAFMDPDSRGIIASHAISLWLRADLDVLESRTARRSNRPLLNQGSPREVLARLIDERYPVYAQADIVVDSMDRSLDAMVEICVRAVRKYYRRVAKHQDSGPARPDTDRT